MNCVLCQHDQFEVVSEVDAKSRKPLEVSQCLHCGLVQQTPMPTAEELRAYYEHEYRLDYKNSYTPKPKHVHRAGKMALERIQFLQTAASAPQGSVLDIGAGGGEFVYLCSQRGLTAVQGIEPNKGYCEYAQQELGVKIEQKQWQALEGKFDIITMFHVFEHLRDPLEVFQKLYELMNPGGWLFIEVPWIETTAQSPSNIFFKAHTLYFSADSLAACGSPYFVPELVETQKGNLRILFRPRETPVSLQWPSAEAVQASRKRLKEKGWLEYLTAGKGILKPFEKVSQLISESKMKDRAGKTILNDLLKAG